MHRTFLLFVVFIALSAITGLAAVGHRPPSAGEIKAAQATGRFTVLMDTTRGMVTIQVDAKAAPLTAANFLKLAQSGFYSGIRFHRVVPGFVAQAGDPTGTGSGGPGYTIKDEVSPLRHEIGALGMAKTSAPNSAGSQFYICLARIPHLDGGYTVFGRVTRGMEVVKQLTQADKIKKMIVKPALRERG